MTTLRSLKYASAFLAGLTAVSVAPGSGNLIEGRARAAEAPQPAPAPAPAKTDCALNESELRAAYDPSVLRSGDRLKLAFYEILEPQDDKWGADKQRLQEPTKGIQLRAELSKEYVVRDDGTISIPILGSFALDGKRQSDVQAKLASAFETFLGRKGFVDIAEVARRPIYVVGKVKNSGSYEYTPGMTVLHAVALAGGFNNPPIEQWQVAELSRGAERIQESLEHAARLMARTIAISAVQTQTSAASPAELNELAGTQSANRLIVEEVAPRKLAMEAHIEEVKELKSSVDSARWDLKLRSDRVPLLEQALAMRQDRLKGLSKLAESGNVARPVLQQAQSEILDEQDRRQEILMSIDVAKDRLQKAEQDLRMRESEANVAGEKDFLNARTEAGNALADATSAIETIKAVAASTLATPPVQDIKFVVVRHSKCGSVPIAATDVTQLEPGDLVQATGSARSPQVEALGSNQ